MKENVLLYHVGKYKFILACFFYCCISSGENSTLPQNNDFYIEKTMYKLMYSFKAYLETGLDDLWCDLSYKFTVWLTLPDNTDAQPTLHLPTS